MSPRDAVATDTNKSEVQPAQETDKAVVAGEILRNEEQDLTRGAAAIEAITDAANEAVHTAATPQEAQTIFNAAAEAEQQVARAQREETMLLTRVMNAETLAQMDEMAKILDSLRKDDLPIQPIERTSEPVQGETPSEKSQEVEKRMLEGNKEREREQQIQLRMHMLRTAATSPESMERYTRSQQRTYNEPYITVYGNLKQTEQDIQKLQKDVEALEAGTYKGPEPKEILTPQEQEEVSFRTAVERNEAELKLAMQSEDALKAYADSQLRQEEKEAKLMEEMRAEQQDLQPTRDELQKRFDELLEQRKKEQKALIEQQNLEFMKTRPDIEMTLNDVADARRDEIATQMEGEEAYARGNIIDQIKRDGFLEKFLHAATDTEREKMLENYAAGTARKLSSEIGLDVPIEIIRQEAKTLGRTAQEAGARSAVVEREAYREAPEPQVESVPQSEKPEKEEEVKQQNQPPATTPPPAPDPNPTPQGPPPEKPDTPPETEKEPEVITRVAVDELGGYVRDTIDRWENTDPENRAELDIDELFKIHKQLSGGLDRNSFEATVNAYVNKNNETAAETEAEVNDEPGTNLGTFVRGYLDEHLTTNSPSEINYDEIYNTYRERAFGDLDRTTFEAEAREYVENRIDQNINNARESLDDNTKAKLAEFFAQEGNRLSIEDLNSLYHNYIRNSGTNPEKPMSREEFVTLVNNAVSRTQAEGRRPHKAE